ncbi:uncharacterized protein LOC132201767 isoform X2 [Neocloeon triangulifer]|uniref:uncharacterized protein LOC132201767 isoform X2 n=1 Tax=Neocloeon triangulifer TaxID=2078957 RepID=UPI00286F1907|nr:uncharacterized protein LOC132201767 isoform X2 [Neocloeon triangulifer]
MENGVVGLLDNTFILERLEDVPETEVVLTDDEDDMGDGKSSLSNGIGDYSNARRNVKKPELFCQLCNKPSVPNCSYSHSHELCKYDTAVEKLEKELTKEKNAALVSAEKALKSAEQLSILAMVMDDAWNALRMHLDHTIKDYNEQQKIISDAKYSMESQIDVVQVAKAGNISLLQDAIGKARDQNQDMEFRARTFDDKVAQWQVFTNCTAQIKLNEINPAFPIGNFDINLDLHEQNNSPECLCLMYAINRFVENRLQTKRMDNLLGGVNAFGSNTVQAISASLPSAADLTDGETNNNKNGYKLEVVDTSKSKTTIAQIVATKSSTPAPVLAQVAAAPKQVVRKSLTTTKYPDTVHCFFDLFVENNSIGRVVMEVYFNTAPIMARNFIELCTGVHGFGYKCTDLWQVPDNDHVVGGHLREGEKISIYNRKEFHGDSSPLHDGVGMLRMRGHGTSSKGEAVVASQFMIWMKPKVFKNYARTLVFGKVVKGMDVLRQVPTMVNKKDNVPFKRILPARIVDCGIGQ